MTVSAPALAATVPAELVVFEGGIPTGAPNTIGNVFNPAVVVGGHVAITGTITGGESYVFVDDQVVWLASDGAPAALQFIDGAVGLGPTDDFIIQIQIDGANGLWVNDAPFVQGDDPAPGFALGSLFGFMNRPTIDGNNTAYFRATVDADGNGSNESVALYSAANAQVANLAAIIRSGDMVDGVEIASSTSAVDNDFGVSNDGSHIVVVARATGSSLTSDLVILDDTILAREGDPVPGGATNWGNFDLVSTNNSGDVMFTGDDDGPTSADEYIAFNGSIVVHEGDMLDGAVVVGNMRQLALNDAGNAGFIWTTDGMFSDPRTAFFACDGSDLVSTAQVVLTLEDTIDIDDDGVGDLTVTEIRGTNSDPGRILNEELALYLEVDLDPGDINAVIRVPVSCCGDGVTQAGEDCDDDNDDDTDDCPSTCETATCGDGFVWAGNEECDDGNLDDGDGCDSACFIEVAGSSSGGSSSGTMGSGSGGSDSGTTGSGTDGTSSGTGTETGTGSSGTGTEGTSSGSDGTGSGTDGTDSGTDGTGSGSAGSSSGEAGSSTGVASTGAVADTTGADTTGADTGSLDTTGDGGMTTAPNTSADGDGSSSGETDTDGDTGGQVFEATCACVSGQRSAPWALLLLGFVWRRRRTRT
ncbi:MAG: DUF4215 domain-containing protein [Myxococcota bacterium]